MLPLASHTSCCQPRAAQRDQDAQAATSTAAPSKAAPSADAPKAGSDLSFNFSWNADPVPTTEPASAANTAKPVRITRFRLCYTS